MWIPSPGIDDIAARVQAEFLDRLAEGTVGIAILSPQLNNYLGTQNVDQEHREWDVLMPCRVRRKALGVSKTDRMCE